MPPPDDPTTDPAAPFLRACRDAWTDPGEAERRLGSSAADGFGRYRGVTEIGRGGMGIVYRARDPEIGREVAIKAMPGDKPALRRRLARFLAEARITGQLEHPNIVPVHEMGTTPDGRRYFAMRLVRGQSLAERLEAIAAGRLDDPLQRRLVDFLKVLDAVAFAHSRGVVHRDLKPANVMIGEFGEVQVMDWGIAKVAGASEDSIPPVTPDPSDDPDADPTARHPHLDRTAEGTVLGTPFYSSPEQVAGRVDAIDARSDVYSLGATLYQVATLESPFRASTRRELTEKICRGRLRPPSAVAAGVDRELEAVILKAMAVDPADRYPTATALRSDLEAYLDGRLLSAARYSPVQRMRKWVGRHRWGVSLAVALVAVAIGLTLLFRWREAVERSTRVEAALLEAAEAIEEAGRLDAPAPIEAVDPATGGPVAESIEATGRRESMLASYLTAVRASERALAIEPGSAAARDLRVAAGIGLGRTALAGGDYTLARQAFLDLADHGVPPEQVEARLAEVRTASEAVLAWRADRLRAVLADLAAGLTRPGRSPGAPLLEEYVAEASAYRDPQTVEILARALEPLIARAATDDPEFESADLDGATFVCRVLGRLGLPGAARPLARFLLVVDHPDLVVEAGLALCDTRDPRAAGPLWRTAERLGLMSTPWKRIARRLGRIPRPPLDDQVDYDSLIIEGFWSDQTGQTWRALEAWDRAVSIAPLRIEAYIHRSRAHLEAGRLLDAISDADRGLVLFPDMPDLLATRGRALAGLGRAEEALATIDRAIEVQGDLASNHFERGRILVALDRPVEALESFDQAIALDGERSLYRLERGRARDAVGDAVGALGDKEMAVALDPDHSLARRELGASYLRLGRLDDAASHLARAVALAPDDVEARVLRACLRRQRGETTAAAEDRRRAMALEPDGRVHAEAALGHVGRRQLEEADERAALALELDAGSGVGYQVRGLCRVYRGEYQAARLDLTRAIERGADTYDVRLWRGAAHVALGLLDQAAADLEVAIRMDPRDPRAIRSRGVLRLRRGDAEGALDDARLAAAVAPGEWLPIVDEGRALEALGRTDEAIAAYLRARAKAPDSRRQEIDAALERLGGR